MSRNTYATILVCLLMVAGAVSVFCSDESSAAQGRDIGDINVHCFSDGAEFATGDNSTFKILITNTSGATSLDTYEINVSAAMSSSDHMGVDVTPSGPISLDKGDSGEFNVVAWASTSAVSGDYKLTVTVVTRHIDTDVVSSDTLTFDVSVTSDYSSEGYRNKVMGVYEFPINNPGLAALVSLVIWIVVAMLVDVAAKKLLMVYAKQDCSAEGTKDAKGAGRYLFVVVLLIGIQQCLRIWDINERIVANISNVVSVVLCLCIAYIVWKIYKVVTYHIVVTRDRDNKIDDSLYPLIKMAGKTVIVIVTLSVVLAIYGMDLATIVTSAGIATLAISLGAQSTLNQFFCGLVLLSTRPFRIGDKIKLGDDSEVLIVNKIGIMETEFKVWLNEEIQHIPNSTVMSSAIVNITKGDKCYKVVDYIDIDYNADIDKARDIILAIANAHPKVVTDGSKSMPDFRFSSMEDSAIRIRLSYIVDDHEVWHAVSCQVKEAIYKKFQVEGIKVPYNIIDVHME